MHGGSKPLNLEPSKIISNLFSIVVSPAPFPSFKLKKAIPGERTRTLEFIQREKDPWDALKEKRYGGGSSYSFFILKWA